MFSNIANQLDKTKGFSGENTTEFERLLIAILIKNFYKFSFMIDRLL